MPNMDGKIKVVWLIQNLVPYHHARFEAFASAFDGEAHLVQVTDRDEFDVLEFQAPERSYVLHTLFPGRKRTTLPGKDLWAGLNQCLRGIAPDCVCVSGWGMEIGRMMQLWSLFHRVPSVMFSESTAYDMERSRWKEWIKGKLVAAASSALVGGTPHADYVQRLGMDPSAVFLGHNVVDSAHFSAPAPERPSSLPADLEQDPYYVVCTRFGRKKNIPALVRAYAAYEERCRESGKESLRLVIAGDGELREEVEAAVAEYDAAGRVLLLGAVGYVVLPWLYQNSQAFVHASTTEQWGLVVNEAMAAGAPVLVSRRTGCAPDLVQDGRNGFQFDPHSESDMSEILWQFANLPTERKRDMGRCSREIVSDWGPDRFAAGLASAVGVAMQADVAKKTLLPRLLLRFLLGGGVPWR